MKTIILTLEEAVKTGLDGAELLNSKDKIIFVYPEGKDAISIAVHNMLSSLRCQTDFVKVPVLDSEKENEKLMLACIAYLAGANENTFVIDDNNKFVSLSYLNIDRSINIRSINLDDDSFLSGQDDKKKPVKRRSTKKDKESPTENIVTELSVEDNAEKSPDKNKSVDESIVKVEVKRSRPRKTKKKSGISVAEVKSLDDFKAMLKTFATDEFDPSTMAMGIFESVKKSIWNKTSIDKELKDTIIIDKKIDMINEAIGDYWADITTCVKNVLNSGK